MQETTLTPLSVPLTMWPVFRLDRPLFWITLVALCSAPWVDMLGWRLMAYCLLALSLHQAWRQWRDWQWRDASQREALAMIPEGVIVTDADFRIVNVNPAFTRASGYAPADVRGLNATTLAAPRHDAAFFESLWQTVHATGIWEGEIWQRRKQGGEYPEWLKVQPVQDRHGHIQHYVCVLSDIAGHASSERDLRRIGFEDPLTGLPNRRRLHELLGSRLRHMTPGEKLDLAVIDVDGFRAINEGLGSELSDRLLVLIGRRLNEFVPGGNVGRLGGNQFLVLRPSSGQDHADWVARLQHWMAAPFELPGQVLRLGVTIGSCQAPEDGLVASALFQRLESALFHAKRNGRNHALRYCPSQERPSRPALGLLNDLRSALANGGQLELYYQPQYRMRDNAMTGLEALLRWRHPQEGLILPADFIPLAECHGLMASLGNWVIDQTLAQMADWRDRGRLEVPVWINISAVQLFQGDVEAALQAGLARHRLDARLLGLELTETALLDERAGDISPRLEALRERGHPVALDDFGTGYSSLGYLTRLPLDKLKLDRTFVEALPGDRANAAIVSAVLAMARGLSLAVVAEGVETPAQRDFLREAGCDEVQGFLYAPPLVAADI